MNTETENNTLVITAIGADKPGLVERLTARIGESGCNIDESSMAALGGQCALILRVRGPWHALSKLEGQLPALGQQLELILHHERTGKRKPTDAAIPYTVELVSPDRPGVVHNLAAFFARNGINIEELQTSTYPAQHTETPTLSVVMTVAIPASMQIANLRGDFLDYCDDLNLDATFEPLRG